MSATATTWTLRFSDGSGNAFRLERDPQRGPPRLSYDPVRPLTSSSGTYDGGEAHSDLALTESVAEQLWQRAQALIADTRQHQTARSMGTGLLRWVCGDDEGRVILTPTAGRAFEARLRALVDNPDAPD